MEDLTKRSAGFSRNTTLEQLLDELNSLLGPANQVLVSDAQERFSKVLVMGPLRSGTTLFTQWLAATGLTAYPTNLLSRFYGAPLIGAKIQQLLTDPRYNFRNEILDFNSTIDFSSENGKTQGALAPNEFWYFWRRFLPFRDLDYLPDGELRARADLAGLRDELNALANIFEKPFSLKAMIMNQNIPVLDSLFDKVLFVWVRRDPIFNIQSALAARKRQYGDIRTWYSFKIKEYPRLEGLEPLESVTGQVHAINRSVQSALDSVPEHKKLVVQYEDFCRDPRAYYAQIVTRLREQHGLPPGRCEYTGELQFKNTNCWWLEEYTRQQAEQTYAAISVDREAI